MAKGDSSRGHVEDLPLSLIDIGTAQVRTDLSSGIDELVQSIRRQGLLQPILVVKKPDGRYEVIAGQRRFLAHQRLGLETIRAIVRDAKDIDETDRVALSLTENMIRRDNSQKELIDACTKLYRRYGSIKMVAEETGLAAAIVGQYVKYDQLVPELKQKVDAAQLDMKVALQAQRAATAEDGSVDAVAASKFAEELAPLSNDAFEEAGMPHCDDLVALGRYYSVEDDDIDGEGYEQVRRFLAFDDPPTAVFAACDLLAAGALQALYEANLRVPLDVSVVGFDDTLASRLAPPLTTVRLPMKAIGAAAAGMVLDAQAGADLSGRTETLTPNLVVRRSTGPAPAR
jgi:ParB/RepB/Spo0J family partition protein